MHLATVVYLQLAYPQNINMRTYPKKQLDFHYHYSHIHNLFSFIFLEALDYS